MADMSNVMKILNESVGNPEVKKTLLVENGKLVETKLNEAVNPENEKINKLIKDVLEGKSSAYETLEKMGYEVNYNPSARKQFGRKYFGDRLTIKNKETGKEIYSDLVNEWESDDFIRAGENILKGGRFGSANVDKDKFDYKNFLDKKPNDNEGDTLGKEVDQFKKDKRFLKDEEYTAKQIDAARERLNNVRSKMKKSGSIKESADEMSEEEYEKLEKRLDELEKEIKYEKRKMKVTAYGKSDLQYLEGLEAEREEIRNKLYESVDERKKIEDRIADLRMTIEDGQLSEDELQALEKEVETLESKLNTKPLKEDANIDETVGGRYDEFIDDLQSVRDALVAMASESRTSLSKEVIESLVLKFDESLVELENEVGIEITGAMNESCSVKECDELEIEGELEECMHKDDTYMLTDGKKFYVGKNFNVKEPSMEDVKVFSLKEEAEEDYKGRLQTVIGGGSTKPAMKQNKISTGKTINPTFTKESSDQKPTSLSQRVDKVITDLKLDSKKFKKAIGSNSIQVRNGGKSVWIKPKDSDKDIENKLNSIK